MRFLILAISLLGPSLLFAVEHTGTVRAADQFIPGAAVTASQGGAKLVTYTDERGRYALDLTPGEWQIEIKMFGFKTLTQNLTVTDQYSNKDWTLEMPRPGEPVDQPKPAAVPTAPKPAAPAAAAPATAATPAAPAPRSATAGQGGGRSGRGPGNRLGGRGGGRGQGQQGQQGQQQGNQPAYQNADVTATDAGAQALAAMAGADMGAEANADTSDAFMMNGSTSGGLAAASDDFARAGRGGRGPGGPGALGGPDSGNGLMTLGQSLGGPGGDPLGMGGFGAAGADAGFGAGGGAMGLGGGPGGGGGGGAGGGRGGGGGGGGRGGGRGGGGGGASGRGRGGRGPFGGQYAQFGNRRGRGQQSPYQGSIAVTATNSALNAAPFSLNGLSQPKPSSANETIAFNFGGPVRIPHIVSNDKWSFYVNFTNHEGRTANNQVNTVPTDLERTGDFSQTTQTVTYNGAKLSVPVVLFDPLSNAPFPNAAIPANRLSPAALSLLNYFPQPTYPDPTTYNYAISESTPSTSNSLGVRLQGSVTNKDRISFNQQYQMRNSTSEQLYGFKDTSKGYGLSSTAQWTHVFKPRVNNSAQLAFSRNLSKSDPYFVANNINVEGPLGIEGPNITPLDYGPPSLGFANFGSLSDGTYSSTRAQTTNFTDTFTYIVKKNHNTSFGVGYRRMQNNVLSYASSRGSFSFTGSMTQGPQGANCGASQGSEPNQACGYDLADFLLGYVDVSSLRTGNDNNYFRGWTTNAYAMDDWRVSRGLTINFGARYEYFAPYTELYGHLANLDVNPAFTAVDVVTAGGTGNGGIGNVGTYFGAYPQSLLKGDPHAFSPRFGLAWRPSQKNSRLIRLGYSIFYSGSGYSGFATQMAAQPPFAQQFNITGTLASPITLLNAFPPSPNTLNNQYAINPNYHLGYTQTWTVALQQTLPHNLLMELEYVGIKGTGLPVTIMPNQPVDIGVNPPNPAGSAVRIPNASSFSYQTDIADSIMHAAQVRLTRRFTRGISAVALYTFSKSIDDQSNNAEDPFNLRLDRALSSTDQRHRLSVTYTASSPVGVRGLWRNGGWKTRMLSGWTTGGGFTYATGTPLTPSLAKDTSSWFTMRPFTTGAPLNAPGDPYFNTGAFSAQIPVGQYGDAGRDIITGVPTLSLNAQLNRVWRFGESRKQIQLQFRTNNVLNHVYISSFGTAVGSNNYGYPTGASATRTVTCVLRFNF
jgi:hypothetical protein